MEDAKIHPVISRMLEIADELGMSTRKFELSIHKSNGYINGMRNRGGAPTVDVLLDIVDTYPQYNIVWLVTGEGDKLVNNGYAAEPSTDYLRTISSGKFENVLKEFVLQIVKTEVDPRFKRLAESLQILMKRSFNSNESVDVKNKKAN